jgi:hypothetical protein
LTKAPKISQRGDTAGADFADLQLIDHAFLEGLAGFGGGGALGEDQAAAFAVNINHHNVNLLY